MAHDHAIGHGGADDEYRETPPGSTYEHTDANVWLIVKFLFWLAVSAALIHAAMGGVYELLIRRAQIEEQPYPLAVGQETRLPPAPRLQQFPTNDIYQFRLEENRLLEGYGWMNREAGIVHIPIEDAMRLTLERGVLQSVPADPAQPAAPAPGLMPADSSAGRTLEQRRQ